MSNRCAYCNHKCGYNGTNSRVMVLGEGAEDVASFCLDFGITAWEITKTAFLLEGPAPIIPFIKANLTLDGIKVFNFDEDLWYMLTTVDAKLTPPAVEEQ